MSHELKIWPEHFDNVISGRKTFELRKNDRDYKAGDIAVLRCYDPDKKEYTGASCSVYVSYVLYGKDTNFGLNSDFCIMSIEVLSVFYGGSRE